MICGANLHNSSKFRFNSVNDCSGFSTVVNIFYGDTLYRLQDQQLIEVKTI